MKEVFLFLFSIIYNILLICMEKAIALKQIRSSAKKDIADILVINENITLFYVSSISVTGCCCIFRNSSRDD